jgi:hypothetical protein
MANLSFGTFVWPNDPEKYREKSVREPIYIKNDDGSTTFSGMGEVKRTVTGSGVFFGSNAYSNFKSLLALVGQKQAAKLVHPIWGTRTGYLTELISDLEPREDYVAYSFTFLEEGTGSLWPY